MASLSEFIWAEEECGSGLLESAIRERESLLCLSSLSQDGRDWVAFVLLPHCRFPKDVVNVMFDCSETL